MAIRFVSNVLVLKSRRALYLLIYHFYSSHLILFIHIISISLSYFLFLFFLSRFIQFKSSTNKLNQLKIFIILFSSFLSSSLLFSSLLLSSSPPPHSPPHPWCPQRCKKPILDAHIEIGGKHFHEDCLICENCGKKATKDFYEDNGKIYHLVCE